MPKTSWIIWIIVIVTLAGDLASARGVVGASTAVDVAGRSDETFVGRTFMRIKRFQQFVLVPFLLSKLSLIVLMLATLIVLTLKGLLIGKFILLFHIAAVFFKIGAFISKFKASWPMHHHHPQPHQAHGAWQRISYPATYEASYPQYYKIPTYAEPSYEPPAPSAHY